MLIRTYVFFAAIALVSFMGVAHAEISGGTRGVDLQCLAGYTGVDNGFKPLKQGEVCLRTPVGDNEAFALECAGIKNPVVISQCDQGVCVAKIGCDGKSLTGTPDVPVDSGGSTSPGGSTGSSGSSGGSGGSGGSGDTLPSGNDPLDAFNPPTTPAPVPQPGTGSTGGVVINPDGGAQLPEVSVVQDPAPTSGGTGAQVKPGTIVPKPVGNPNAGAESLLYPGSTFSGVGSSIGNYAGSTGQNLFTTVFSNLIGNLFGELFNSPGLSAGVSLPNTSPQPTSMQTRPAPVLDDRTNATLDRLMGKPVNPLDYELPRNASGFPIVPKQSNDRTGLDIDFFEESLTGPRPQPTTDEGNPTFMPRPGVSLDPVQLTPPMVVADAGGVVVPLPLKHPDWWTSDMIGNYAQGVQSGEPDREAYRRARSETISVGLQGLYARTTAPDSPEGKILRRLLEEDVRIAQQTRDRAYLERSLPFVEWIDKNILSISAGQRALDAANVRLAALGELESRYGLTDAAGGSPQSRIEILVTDGPVAFDEENAINLFDIPGVLATRGFERVRALWGGAFVENTATAPTVSAPPVPTPSELVPPPTLPPTPAPAAESPAPSSFLERLSTVANRVREAIGFSANTRVPEAPANPSQDPTPPTLDSTPNQGNRSLAQMGMGLVNALVQGLAALFLPSHDDASISHPATTPAPRAMPAATITASPIEVEPGLTTQLSWSSVGADSCAIVDARLRVIARGIVGATTSPTLSQTTRFGIICDITGGEDKFLNEVLVRVKGSASSTLPLFSNSGRASTATSFSSEGGASGGAGSAPTPIDVRTCNPEQSIETYITCLCEAEPNPAGCSVPPGGV